MTNQRPIIESFHFKKVDGSTLAFFKRCHHCKDEGCYWCLASHTEECRKATNGHRVGDFIIGNCQSMPCAYDEHALSLAENGVQDEEELSI